MRRTADVRQRQRVAASASVQFSVTDTAVSTFVRRDTSEQLGARVTVIETVAGFEFAVPSYALYVNESGPM